MVAFEKAPPEARQLLTVPIRELGLSLERSPVAPFVRALYAELDAAGLRRFRPRCYLSDEWGCPSEEPLIGIPFYLGDPRVAHLEDVVNDVESEQEILRYLRHEAGHAFNYAYELFRAAEWHELFGSFLRPYRDDFPFVPFSKDYVRHIAGWYAQKHPDEDFAETFAVWLDPGSNWGAHDLGDRAPVHVEGETDVTVEEMAQTVEEFYRETTIDETRAIEELALDADLTDIFVEPARQRAGVEYRAATQLLAAHRRDVVDKINYGTGVRRTLVRALVMAVERRLGELDLAAESMRSRTAMVELTVYLTTLAMTFLTGNRRLRH